MLLGAGCASAPERTERSEREKRLQKLEAGETYDDLWRAAQLCAELADKGTEQRPRNQREEFAKRGMALAERAIALQGEGVEGHYYRALCIGRYLDAERLPSFTLVSVLRDEGERAAALDPGYEFAGAHRLLGELYSQAPEFGPGGVGDKDKANENFQRACAISGGFPENHLGYARFLVDMERFETASEEIQRALDAAAKFTGFDEAERSRFEQACEELRKQLPQK